MLMPKLSKDGCVDSTEPILEEKHIVEAAINLTKDDKPQTCGFGKGQLR